MPSLSPSLRTTGLAAVLLLPWLQAALLRADDWPQWRGPNRDGVWRETGILESFPAGGPAFRWRVPVGFGYSSPVVAQGRVYLTDSLVTRPRARERVLCFDETTGALLWSHVYEVTYPEWAFTPAQEGRPTSTPLVGDGRVYAVGAAGDLFCLDARQGTVLWKKNLEKQYQAAEFTCRSSPLLDGDLLILSIGGKPGACVVALDKTSGNEVWRALDERVTYSSPILLSAGGARQLIVWTQESVTSLDPATGKTHWRQRLMTSSNDANATPVVHHGRLLIGGLMLQLDPDKPAASVLWPDTLAASRRILSNTSTALVQGEYLYSAKSSGEFVCLEAGTGKQVWKTDRVTDQKGGASIHPTAHGDAAFLFTDRGELIRAKLTPQDYQEVSRARLVEPTYPFGGRNVAWAPPAYANRHVFARSDKELVCASLAANR
jgi:outer membrane protein assembly factor BamB